jgi:hypothetical protein
MLARPWLLALVGSLALAGCTHAAEGQAATAPTPTPTTPPNTIEANDITIDLSPHGMAASITAPHDAKVSAADDGVVLEGGDGFHLIVHRGALDPLEEKADIVKRYGVGFRRFVSDRGNEVIYETSFAGENRFHFFFTSKADVPIAYHCRTPNDGIPVFEEVETMIKACRDITFRAEIDASEVSMAEPKGAEKQ